MTTPHQAATTAIQAASAVTALVGTDYWPDFRKNENTPALIFRDITQVRHDHLSGPGKGKRARIQFTAYDDTRSGADALGDALEVALSSTSNGRVVFRQSGFDSDVEVYFTQLDWLVYIDNPT